MDRRDTVNGVVRRAAAGSAAVCCLLLPQSFIPSALPSAQAVSAAQAASAARASCAAQRGQPQLYAEPWAQRRLDLDRVWAVTRGRDITVAVIDTGVDTAHPQLKGRVTAVDLTKSTPDDCHGHGTAVSGIIAASDMRTGNVPFTGVAPESRILSIKYTGEQSDDKGTAVLADGIRRAAERGAKVINVSVRSDDTAELRDAVKFAQSRDVVVVAAVGNVKKDDKGSEGPAFPASYPGVISVAAVDESGKPAEFSNTTTPVSVSAPGKGVASLAAGGGYWGALDGTSFATPFVSGVAALVRSYHTDLTYQQVKHRIEVTAGGASGVGTGRGMVDPLNAVTSVLPEEGPAGQASPPAAAAPIELAARAEADTRTRAIALTVTIGALVAGALVAAGGVVIPLGRRRGWRPGRPAVERRPPGGRG
jgi:type VII secretion-associated serine protease mycosin